MKENKILFNIDEIKIENGLFVRGWFFSTAGNEINFKNIIKDIKRCNREDVKLHYKEYEGALSSGVELILPIKKTKLIITDGNSEEVFEINPWKIMKENKIKEINDYYKLINLNNVQRGVKFLAKNGIKKTYSKLKNINKSNEINYMDWFENHMPTEEEMQKQREHKFDYQPKISIATPTWNTKENFLIDMIESVRNQTYSNWELCLADGASTNKDTLKLLKEYQKKDKRIKVKYLDKNYMISGNTNEALTLATGDYIGLFDHDDLLTENCLYEVVKVINEEEADFIYTDEDKTDEEAKEYFGAHFKQDWAPYTLRSYNYITHFSVFKKELLNEIGNFRSEYDGSQDYDIILRLTEKAEKVFHIPKILYHWRVHKESVASGAGAKPYAYEAAKRALKSHLERQEVIGEPLDGLFTGGYKINYKITNSSKVSIIIPNNNHKKDLKKCIDSIRTKTTYKNYEIIIVENNSNEDEIFDYYKELKEIRNIKVVTLDQNSFNYSELNNFGVQNATGNFLILLNNDTEIITNSWIEEYLMLCQQKDVGVVGGKLFYEDNTIQHAGVYIGIGGIAAHLFENFNRYDHGPIGRLSVIQNVSAVTGACMMIKRSVFEEVKGLDQNLFKVAYNDVDFCLKIIEKGYQILWTPFVELYHYESKSRGYDDTAEKIERLNNERNNFLKKWGNYIEKGDPYYNKNLTLDRADFSLRN